MARPRTYNIGHSEGDVLRRLGGRAAVDFVNTVDHDRPDPETLKSYADFVAWSEAAGLFTAAQAKRLRSAARADPDEAGAQLGKAMQLRELARRLFEARAHGRAPPRGDLVELNRMIGELHDRKLLSAVGLGFARAEGDAVDLSAPLSAILDELANFLVSVDFHHLGRCQGPDCGWFFIDKTPKRRRRWCSMASCGNREKAHRHYVRRRAAST